MQCIERAVAAAIRSGGIPPEPGDGQHGHGANRRGRGRIARSGPDRAAKRQGPQRPGRHPGEPSALRRSGGMLSQRAGYSARLWAGPQQPGQYSQSAGASGGGREPVFARRSACSPTWCRRYNNLANTLKTLGDADEAIRQYREALRIAPEYVEAYYNLAITFKEQGQVDEAIAAYREALRIRPNFVEARFNLGNLFKTPGAVARGGRGVRGSHRPATRISPKRIINWPACSRSQGDVGAPTTSIETAVRLKPALAEAHQGLANLLRDQGRSTSRLPVTSRPCGTTRRSFESLNNLAIALRASAGRRRRPTTVGGRSRSARLRRSPRQPGADPAATRIAFEEALASHREAVRLKPELGRRPQRPGRDARKPGPL